MALERILVTQNPKYFSTHGLFFKVIQASDTVEVRFQFHDDSELDTELYQGLAIEHLKEFKGFWISSETQQEITMFASQAKMIDDRLETSLTGSAHLESGNAPLVANIVAEVVPVRLGRRSVLIEAEENTYIGGVNLDDTNGILIEAGESIELETQAAVFGLSAVNCQVRTLSEVN